MTVPRIIGPALALPVSAAAALARRPGLWSGRGMRPLQIKAASITVLLLGWFAGAALLPSAVLPAPATVVRALWVDLQTAALWTDIGITLARILAAFVVAMAVSITLGFAMGLSRRVESFFGVWIIGLMALPSLVVILTIYMVAGLNERAAVIAAAVPVIPILTINIWDAIKGIDHKLIEMGKAYHAGRRRIVAAVVAPQVAPALLASARFGLGLIWKMVLFVELLGRSDGIGYRIEFFYQLFNMTEVLAYSLAFLVVMLFIEVVVLEQLERRLFAWRPVRRHL